MRTQCGTILAAAVASAALGGELVVSPDGLSPHDALLAIRAAKASGDKGAWTVRVKEGLYTLNETLVFTPEDSGEPDAPVTWIGEDDKTVFAGGQRLTGWKDVGGGVWSAPIPSAPDGRPAFFEQLWVNGRRADRARLPNSTPGKPIDGYLNVAAASISPVTNAEGKVTYIERAAFTNAPELASVPADELQWAQMCVIHKWSFARRAVKSVDPATMTVETHSPEDWVRWRKWDPRCTIAWFENVRSAFDAPGEWFYDAKNGVVLYRPMPGEDMSNAEVLVPSSELSRLVEFKGNPDKGAYVHDIAFKGISFAATSATSDGERGPTQSYQYQAAKNSDGAVTVMGARRLSFDSCKMSHTGNYGMRFNDGCTSNVVINCELDDLGAGGVWMGAQEGYVAAGETLSRRVITTLAPRSTAFNRLENCIIRRGGKFNPEGTGVALTHVSDSKVLHCEICDFMYTGVSVGFVWGFMGSVAQRNEIAFNKIYDLGKGVMSDMGGVYTLGTSYGTTVHDNVIHDVWAYAYGGWALYADEGSEGIVMERNLCWNTTDGGFHQHYGVGCVIRNNIFAWNRKLGAVRTARQVVQDIPCTLNFVNNIVVVKEGPLVGKGPRGVGGVWAGNLWYDYSGKPELDGLDWNAWKDCGKEIGGAYADPCFVDADANDFRLKPESPAFALGFVAFDQSAVGPRRTVGDWKSAKFVLGEGVIRLGGNYAGHLQDVWRDGNVLCWAHTLALVKTDLSGNVLAKTDVSEHHAGLEVKDGKVYVAVCDMQDKTGGKTLPDSRVTVKVYDAETLKLLESHVTDINDRSGSLAILEDGTFLVGCLRPPDISETQVRFHHLDGNFKLIKSYVLDNVPVPLGIETIKRHNGYFYLNHYTKEALKLGQRTGKSLCIKLDRDFKEVARYDVNGTCGLVFDNDGIWVGATWREPGVKGWVSSLNRVDPPAGF